MSAGSRHAQPCHLVPHSLDCLNRVILRARRCRCELLRLLGYVGNDIRGAAGVLVCAVVVLLAFVRIVRYLALQLAAVGARCFQPLYTIRFHVDSFV